MIVMSEDHLSESNDNITTTAIVRYHSLEQKATNRHKHNIASAEVKLCNLYGI